MNVELQPVGEISSWLLDGIRQGFYTAISYSVSLNPSVPVPPQAYDPTRNQYLADTMIEELYSCKRKGAYLLGITSVDLFTKGKSFVFGEASPMMETAVISLYTLGGPGISDNLVLQRAIKEAVHEVGHLMGMDHCSNTHCVMHFSNSLIDTDFKDAFFCPACKPRLL